MKYTIGYYRRHPGRVSQQQIGTNIQDLYEMSSIQGWM